MRRAFRSRPCSLGATGLRGSRAHRQGRSDAPLPCRVTPDPTLRRTSRRSTPQRAAAGVALSFEGVDSFIGGSTLCAPQIEPSRNLTTCAPQPLVQEARLVEPQKFLERARRNLGSRTSPCLSGRPMQPGCDWAPATSSRRRSSRSWCWSEATGSSSRMRSIGSSPAGPRQGTGVLKHDIDGCRRHRPADGVSWPVT